MEKQAKCPKTDGKYLIVPAVACQSSSVCFLWTLRDNFSLTSPLQYSKISLHFIPSEIWQVSESFYTVLLAHVVFPVASWEELMSRFCGRWRKIVLPSLASMKIIYKTNKVLSWWFSSLPNSSCENMLWKYVVVKISSSFVFIPKWNTKQISKINLTYLYMAQDLRNGVVICFLPEKWGQSVLQSNIL